MVSHCILWCPFRCLRCIVDPPSLRTKLCINNSLLRIALSHMASWPSTPLQKIRIRLSQLVQPPNSIRLHHDISSSISSSLGMADKGEHKFHALSITSRMVSLVRPPLFFPLNSKSMGNCLSDKIGNFCLLLDILHNRRMASH